MKDNPDLYHRHSIRLAGYDYSWAGYYFVTACAQGRRCFFGKVADGEMRLNDAGRIAEECWLAIPHHFSCIELDQYVIMPNHVHGIIIIHPVGATHASPLQITPSSQPDVTPTMACGPKSRSVGSIVGSFKSAVTKRINDSRGTPGAKVWQRNYYEHIIRTEEAFHAIRHYIAENPVNWPADRENPNLVMTHMDVGATHVGATHASPLPDDEPWRV